MIPCHPRNPAHARRDVSVIRRFTLRISSRARGFRGRIVPEIIFATISTKSVLPQVDASLKRSTSGTAGAALQIRISRARCPSPIMSFSAGAYPDILAHVKFLYPRARACARAGRISSRNFAHTSKHPFLPHLKTPGDQREHEIEIERKRGAGTPLISPIITEWSIQIYNVLANYRPLLRSLRRKEGVSKKDLILGGDPPGCPIGRDSRPQ